MLTNQEYEVLKNELTKYFILIPPECVIVRVRDVLRTIEYFIKETEDGTQGKQEGETKAEQVEERVEQISSGEDNGAEPSGSSI